MDEPTERPARRRLDAMSAMMGMITVAAIVGAAWMRFGPSSSHEPQGVAVGAEAPPLRLRDLKTSDPLVLVGLRDKVVWVVFWSAGAPSGRSCLTELAAACKVIRAHRRFALVTAAVEADDPDRVRAAVDASGLDLPVYLASPETLRRFGAGPSDPPLHVLIDEEGRILALARGAGRPTIARIADQARRRLTELDPLGHTRFASRGGRHPDPPEAPPAGAAQVPPSGDQGRRRQPSPGRGWGIGHRGSGGRPDQGLQELDADLRSVRDRGL
jgi:hypothetical protein